MKKTGTLVYLLSLIGTLSAQIQLSTTTVDTMTIAKQLDIPWEILWGPDDQLWVTERFGRVSRIDPTTGNQDVILDISSIVRDDGESGLLGMALHPDFQNTPEVYLVYTYLDEVIQERLVKYTYDGSQLVNPVTLIEDIPGNTTHDGSRLLFLEDTTLLMTTGDAQKQSLPQNVNSLAGKVLRFNTDGSFPADNPIPNSPVWSWGHRNAQGLLLAPNGKVYSSEHGPTTDDELNIIEKGGNYGWPDVHGMCDSPSEMTFCNDSNVIEPILNWTPTIATSDIMWYNHPSIPEFENTILLTVLKNKMVKSIVLDATGTQVVEENDFFNNIWGRIRDICMGPDGAIYLATNGQNWNNSNPFSHSIVKIYNASHPIGIEEVSMWKTRIFPQPAHDRVKLLFEDDLNNRNVRLLAPSGQQVGEWKIRSSTVELDVSNIRSGIYFVEIEHNFDKEVRKLIVQ